MDLLKSGIICQAPTYKRNSLLCYVEKAKNISVILHNCCGLIISFHTSNSSEEFESRPQVHAKGILTYRGTVK